MAAKMLPSGAGLACAKAGIMERCRASRVGSPNSIWCESRRLPPRSVAGPSSRTAARMWRSQRPSSAAARQSTPSATAMARPALRLMRTASPSATPPSRSQPEGRSSRWRLATAGTRPAMDSSTSRPSLVTVAKTWSMLGISSVRANRSTRAWRSSGKRSAPRRSTRSPVSSPKSSEGSRSQRRPACTPDQGKRSPSASWRMNGKRGFGPMLMAIVSGKAGRTRRL